MRHGFLLLHKPRGPTSHDAVAQVRRKLGERSIGHLGTLDPLAEGLLVLAVGAKALKVIELFAGLTKEYVVEITLGAESTTYDGEGTITKTELSPMWKPPAGISDLDVLLRRRFLGKISQVPPAYSAVKIGGERAYRKARQGRSVEIPPRDVVIHELQTIAYDYPRATCRVVCSSGTYMRSFAHDVGAVLHCGGYMSALMRTKVGDWTLDEACLLDDIAWTHVAPLKEVLKHLPSRELTINEWKEIQFGRSIPGSDAPNTVAWCGGLPCALLEPHPAEPNRMKPRKVLV